MFINAQRLMIECEHHWALIQRVLNSVQIPLHFWWLCPGTHDVVELKLFLGKGVLSLIVTKTRKY